MADLAETPADGGLVDETFDGLRIAAEPWRPLASIQPFRGRRPEVEAALGARLPDPGRRSDAALHIALDQWLVEGDAAALSDSLSGLAAVTDQSDAWSFWRLSGADPRPAVARLAPFDPADPRYADGASLRSQLARHPGLVVIEPGARAIRLACPRSYAASFARALREAALA
ncbi:MAG: hypothetical protein AAF192_05180 [Pseudomonadota bacterium]